MKKRMKEEEIEKAIAGRPTPKSLFFLDLSDLDRAVPKRFERFVCMRACAHACVCEFVCVCVCVCVCVTMKKKSARRMASMTSDTGDTSSKQQQAQCKQKYKSKRPVSSVDHSHPYRRKKRSSY